MKYAVERFFNNVNSACLGEGYEFYKHILEDLIYKMKDKIGHPFIGEEKEVLYRNLRFFMNLPFYHKFSIVCKITCHDSDMYRGIKIIVDPTLHIGDSSACPDGIVRLVYEEPTDLSEIRNAINYVYGAKPHIDHVIFNGPATIVFWKDGTKTVVKHDGKGRKDKKQAILYAFIRKIYGEGKPYHNILNEIEEAIY